jgi:hypothetical protein
LDSSAGFLRTRPAPDHEIGVAVGKLLEHFVGFKRPQPHSVFLELSAGRRAAMPGSGSDAIRPSANVSVLIRSLRSEYARSNGGSTEQRAAPSKSSSAV